MLLLYYVGRNYPQKPPKLLLQHHPLCPRGPGLRSPLEPPWTIGEKDRKKKNLVAKSTLSKVNQSQQFCDSRLAKPASCFLLTSRIYSFEQNCWTWSDKKSVDKLKLKTVNAVGLDSVIPLSRANQPKRYTG